MGNYLSHWQYRERKKRLSRCEERWFSWMDRFNYVIGSNRQATINPSLRTLPRDHDYYGHYIV